MAYQVQRSARADLVVQSVEKLNQRVASFIRNFERQEPRMVEIAREMDIIAAAVKAAIAGAKDVEELGTLWAVGATVVGLFAAPFTGGTSILLAAAAATPAAIVVINAKVIQFLLDSGKAKTLERLGNEFMRIARPLSEELKEIKARAKDLKVDVADYILSEMVRRFEKALQKVNDVSGAIEDAMAFMRSLVELVLKIMQHSSTVKEEDELTKKVVKSGEQCWEIINHFRKVIKDLQGFKGYMAIF